MTLYIHPFVCCHASGYGAPSHASGLVHGGFLQLHPHHPISDDHISSIYINPCCTQVEREASQLALELATARERAEQAQQAQQAQATDLQSAAAQLRRDQAQRERAESDERALREELRAQAAAADSAMSRLQGRMNAREGEVRALQSSVGALQDEVTAAADARRFILIQNVGAKSGWKIARNKAKTSIFPDTSKSILP